MNKAAGPARIITLKVLAQHESSPTHIFKIKTNTPFSRLMKMYCKNTGVNMDTVRFRFDGRAINHTDTPESLELEHDDTIEVFTPQTGG